MIYFYFVYSSRNIERFFENEHDSNQVKYSKWIYQYLLLVRNTCFFVNFLSNKSSFTFLHFLKNDQAHSFTVSTQWIYNEINEATQNVSYKQNTRNKKTLYNGKTIIQHNFFHSLIRISWDCWLFGHNYNIGRWIG